MWSNHARVIAFEYRRIGRWWLRTRLEVHEDAKRLFGRKTCTPLLILSALPRRFLFVLLDELAVVDLDEGPIHERYSRSEVKFKSTVSVSEMQSQVDALSREYRELDSRVQEANWSIELVD